MVLPLVAEDFTLTTRKYHYEFVTQSGQILQFHSLNPLGQMLGSIFDTVLINHGNCVPLVMAFCLRKFALQIQNGHFILPNRHLDLMIDFIDCSYVPLNLANRTFKFGSC